MKCWKLEEPKRDKVICCRGRRHSEDLHRWHYGQGSLSRSLLKSVDILQEANFVSLWIISDDIIRTVMVDSRHKATNFTYDILTKGQSYNSK